MFDPYATAPTIEVDGTAKVLSWLRKFAGLSLEEWSAHSGISAAVLGRYEAGYHSLPLNDLLWLARVTRTSVHIKAHALIEEHRAAEGQRLRDCQRARTNTARKRAAGLLTRLLTPEEMYLSHCTRQQQRRQREREHRAAAAQAGV